MTAAFYLTALASGLAILIYLLSSVLVGYARTRHGVMAPATTGPEPFERVFRVQQNTLEQLVLFLPLLWIAYAMSGAMWPAVVGLVWPLGRVVYAKAYITNPLKRGIGFMLTLIPSLILLVWVLVRALIGLI